MYLIANPAFSAPQNKIIKQVLTLQKGNFAEDAVISNGLHITAVSEQETALILDLPRDVPFEISVLDEPPRLVIDLPNVVFPNQQANLKPVGLIQSLRSGWFIAGRSRIIMGLNKPALIDRVDLIVVDNGKRMVFTIKATDKYNFDIAVKESAASIQVTGTVKNKPENKDLSYKNLAQAQGNNSKDAVAPSSPTNLLPLIVIDPGHGGIDPGARGPGGEIEKNLVLTIGKMLKIKLEASGKLRVAMTRESDLFVPLSERVRIARAGSAALFISIHADTLTDEPGVRGATIYTLADKASDAAAAQLADKENKVDQLAGIENTEDKETVSDILFDLARRETRAFSLEFAKLLVSQIQNLQQEGLLVINKNPHRFAGFRVLKAHDIPSVLFEMGYLSSAEDARQMMSPEWQDKLTSAASDAIIKFVFARGQ